MDTSFRKLIAFILGGFAVIVLYLVASNYRTFNTPKAEDPTYYMLSASNTFASIKIEYPVEVLDMDEEMANFAHTSFNTKKEEWKEGGELHKEVEELKKELPIFKDINYAYDISFDEMSSNRTSTKSYLFTIYEYVGGNSGSLGVVTYTFGENGRILIEEVLDLNNGNDIKLTKMVRDRIVETYGEYVDQKMLNDNLALSYLDQNDNLKKDLCNCDGYYYGSNLQNFYITDQGITFVYSKYELLPGAAGIVEATLYFDELNDYVLR